jgi:hypothetical protein
MLLGESIHAGTCREVVGILRATMQHDKQRPLPVRPARNIELVVSATGRAGRTGSGLAVRDLERLAAHGGQPIKAET